VTARGTTSRANRGESDLDSSGQQDYPASVDHTGHDRDPVRGDLASRSAVQSGSSLAAWPPERQPSKRAAQRCSSEVALRSRLLTLPRDADRTRLACARSTPCCVTPPLQIRNITFTRSPGSHRTPLTTRSEAWLERPRLATDAGTLRVHYWWPEARRVDHLGEREANHKEDDIKKEDTKALSDIYMASMFSIRFLSILPVNPKNERAVCAGWDSLFAEVAR
jgi:hypothetical protein